MSYTFVPNKSLGQLLNISPKNVTFLKAFNLELNHLIIFFYSMIILLY